MSRDLEDLGAIKVRAGDGESVYAIPELPKEQRAPEDHLRRVLGEWVVEVAHSGNLVVLRTPPGSAHVVGSALDRADLRRRPRHGRRRRHPDRGRPREGGRRPHRQGAPRLWPGSSRTRTRRRGTRSTWHERVVLAYSGGLDTSVAVRWMIDELGVEVIALAVDVGQASAGLGRRSASGRSPPARVDAVVVDARAEFAEDFVAPALKANALTRAATRWCRRCRGR